jgi:hypothetical protein
MQIGGVPRLGDARNAQLGGAFQAEARAAARQAPQVGGLLGMILDSVESRRA